DTVASGVSTECQEGAARYAQGVGVAEVVGDEGLQRVSGEDGAVVAGGLGKQRPTSVVQFHRAGDAAAVGAAVVVVGGEEVERGVVEDEAGVSLEAVGVEPVVGVQKRQPVARGGLGAGV